MSSGAIVKGIYFASKQLITQNSKLKLQKREGKQ